VYYRSGPSLKVHVIYIVENKLEFFQMPQSCICIRSIREGIAKNAANRGKLGLDSKISWIDSEYS
jgi:hypothetical protein